MLCCFFVIFYLYILDSHTKTPRRKLAFGVFTLRGVVQPSLEMGAAFRSVIDKVVKPHVRGAEAPSLPMETQLGSLRELSG